MNQQCNEAPFIEAALTSCFCFQILINLCSKGSVLKFFDRKDLLTTECLACLVDLMNDPSIKPSLAQKTMVLLSALGLCAVCLNVCVA